MAGDPSISSPSTPPPSPPPPPPHASNPLMLYYGLVVVGTAATVLALYNLIILKWCAENRRLHHHHHRRRLRSGQGMARALEPISSRSSDNPSLQLVVASFRYKKGQRVAEDQGGYESDYECPVCLSVFEEGEELRQLPRCNHIFHAPCIDMWLYSHFDCPVCRAPVEPPVPGHHTTADQSENSRDGLLDSGIPD